MQIRNILHQEINFVTKPKNLEAIPRHNCPGEFELTQMLLVKMLTTGMDDTTSRTWVRAKGKVKGRDAGLVRGALQLQLSVVRVHSLICAGLRINIMFPLRDIRQYF